MVDLRLLTAVLVVAVLSCGCGKIPRWSRRVEGRVLNEETGEPVSGAEVFASYQIMRMVHPGEIDVHWTTTDEKGHFSIPGHIREIGPWWFVSTDRIPYFRIVHPVLGYFTRIMDEDSFPGYRKLEFRISRSRRSLFYFDDPIDYHKMCATRNPAACARLCEVVFGSAEPCERWGLGRE